MLLLIILHLLYILTDAADSHERSCAAEQSKTQLSTVEQQLELQRFEEKVKEGVVLVLFLNPSCGECKKFDYVWKRLAKEKDLKTVDVDCTKYHDICQEFDVGSVPTLKLYINGILGVCDVEKTFDKIIEYVSMEKRAAKNGTRMGHRKGPSKITTLTSDFSNTGTFFVLFCDSSLSRCKRTAPIWEEFAILANGKYTVAQIDCNTYRSVCDKYSITYTPSYQLFIDGKVYVYHGPKTPKSFLGYEMNMQIIDKRDKENQKVKLQGPTRKKTEL